MDISRTLRQLADFMEAQGINIVDTIDGQWYDFSAKIMPNGEDLKMDAVAVRPGRLYPKRRWWEWWR